MKQFLYLELASLLNSRAAGENVEGKRAELKESLKRFTRTADGVCVLTAREAKALELGDIPAVVFIEAEHSSFLTASAIVRFIELWGEVFDDGPMLDIASMHVAVVGRYGETDFISAGRLYWMWQMHLRGGTKSEPIPHATYPRVFLHNRVADGLTLCEREASDQREVGGSC
jgi:hypothetical protein